MILKTKDVNKALLLKGFRITENDHHRFLFYLDGRKTSVHTKTSHSHSEIGRDLIARMARQMRLSKNDFVRFVDCQMTEEDYRTKLISDGQVR